MLLTDHVALTSLTRSVTTGSLMKVAAAIQKQVTRDLSPIWGIRGTVNAFELLTDVPTDYYQVVIFNDTDELLGRLESALGADQAAALVEGFDSQTIGGIHVNAWTRQPFALVQAVDDSWPALASHEILELLVDPYGNRLIAAAHALDASRRVEYLLEICDPCQQIWYTVNGVPVSDFYTPRYFDPVRNDCNRISFTGELTYPLEILDGGYVSFIDPEDDGLYQLSGGSDEPRLVASQQALAGSKTALRTIVDGDTDTPRLTSASLRTARGAVAAWQSGEAVRAAAERCGTRTARAIFDISSQ